MYPVADLDINSSLPTNAAYWVSKPSKISDEGFGYFRDVWPYLMHRRRKSKRSWPGREAAAFAAEQAGAVEEFGSFAKV